MKRILILALTTLALGVLLSGAPLFAAPAVKDPEPDVCIHVATADTIKIFWCENPYNGFEFYTNNLGFMLPETY